MIIKERDPGHKDARAVITRLSEVLLQITGDAGKSSFDLEDMRQSRSVFVVGYLGGLPVACGALRPFSNEIVELKRMYGEKGTGGNLLIDLEERARGFGYTKVWLSTRIVNSRAVKFYQRHGYKQIENYGKYAGRDNSICFEKNLF